MVASPTAQVEKFFCSFCNVEDIEHEIIPYLNKFIGRDCSRICIEYPYYDGDYLSNYYEFYSKKLRLFSKKCCRLLLFQDVPKEDGEVDEELIGYISLRPTYKGRYIGRTFLQPGHCIPQRTEEKVGDGSWSIVHPGTAYVIAPKQKVHFDGKEYFVSAAPHMAQEGDISVCAHISLWGTLRSFSNRFTMYREVRIGELVQMIRPESERLIPSHGLTVQQICRVLLDCGFTPVVRYQKTGKEASKSGGGKANETIMDEILTYIDSGIPVIGVNSKRQHAFVAVGRGDLCSENLKYSNASAIEPRREAWWNNAKLEWEEQPSESTFYLASRLVEELIVNDDNQFPYQFLVTRSDSGLKQLLEENETIKGKPYLYPASEIDGAVVPLYPRIQLDYEAVLNRFKALVEQGFYGTGKTLVVRIFLTSANSLREHVLDVKKEIEESNPHADPELLKSLQNLLRLELSRFVWILETSTPQEYENGFIQSVVIIDSTSATVDEQPIRFPLPDGDGRIIRKDFQGVPRFEGNLTKFSRPG